MNLTAVCIGIAIDHRVLQYLFVILDSVLAIVSVVGNSLVLVTIWRTPRLYSPSNVLLAGLALSDLGVGLVTQPAFAIITIVAIAPRVYCNLYHMSYLIHAVSFNFFVSLSLATLMTISADRYLALRLHLRYQELVTVKRILMVLVIIWIAVVVFNCIFEMLFITGPLCITLCICVFLWCYYQIFKIIRRHQAQIVMPHNVLAVGPTLPNVTRYKKSVFSMLYVLGFFLISYIPWLIFISPGYVTHTQLATPAWHTIEALLFSNSCVNPVLYCWRMREIRQAVKETVMGICSWR